MRTKQGIHYKDQAEAVKPAAAGSGKVTDPLGDNSEYRLLVIPDN